MNIKGFRARVRAIILGKDEQSHPIISSPNGITDERARFQAAMNIKHDPKVKERVLEHLTKETGSRAKAMEKMLKMYPEVGERDN